MTPPESAARSAGLLDRVAAPSPLEWIAILALAALAALLAAPALAQDAGSVPETGTVSGRLFDGQDRSAISGATVILDFPEPEDGGVPRQLVATSGPAGDFEFDEPVPAGFYGLSFVKAGYRASAIANFEVVAGQDNFVEFPMPRQAVSETGDVLELEAYVVEASVVGELMNNLELRLESDDLVNLLSAEDLSKFAASDVADALKRVAGVNVVEGQFAIIRGLEDRYSSTLYNGAPVPSPDPDRQSVQLDLFPSDIVSNLSLSKSFSPDSPSNSAGGSIDIITHDYPEALTFKFSAGTGFNERTLDKFLRFDGSSPIGVPVDGDRTIESDFSALFGGRGELFDRELRFKVVAAREIDYQTADGLQGESEPKRSIVRAPPPFRQSGGLSTGLLDRRGPRFRLTESSRQEQITWYLGLGIDLDLEGDHRIDGSYFHTRKTDETVQLRDEAVIPGLDYGRFGTGAPEEPSDFTNNEFVDHWIFDWWTEDTVDGVEGGEHAYFSPVEESRSFDRERELDVYQLNGAHDLDDWVEGLGAKWVASYAETEQEETTLITRYSYNTVENFLLRSEGYENVPTLPARPEDFVGRGLWLSRSDIVFGQNEIEENQYFGRLDLDYEFEPFRNVEATARTGYWFEQANRTTTSYFEDQPSGVAGQPGVFGDGVPSVSVADFDSSSSLGGGPNFTILGDDPIEMGRRIFAGAGLGTWNVNSQQSVTKREVSAWSGELKLTFFGDVDVIAGVRLENLRITSNNDPYTGFCSDATEFVNRNCADPTATPTIFPFRTLFLDRIDNPLPPPVGDNATGLANTTFNDEILGIQLPRTIVNGVLYVDCKFRECLDRVLRGEIDEFNVLPSASLAWRPWDGWVFRFAYSQTVARPSFREMSYYVSSESGSDDFFVGNPLLETSDVESLDGRVEWTFGDFGDLFALSVFHKTIDKPIEQLLLTDPTNVGCVGVCTFRTYANNQGEAELLGMEVEGRRTLDFLGSDALGGFLGSQAMSGFLETISLGGNFTYIDAEVERNPIQRERSQNFIGLTAADAAAGLGAFDGLSKKRRLFGQPEWIANADLTFDHPDWGTKATLSIFAISEVLDAVGSGEEDVQRGVQSFTLDRYIDQYYQLDLVMSQAFTLPRLPGEFTAKASIKNLTDTTRKVIYDQEQTVDDVRERSFKVGRDYSFSIGYTLTY